MKLNRTPCGPMCCRQSLRTPAKRAPFNIGRDLATPGARLTAFRGATHCRKMARIIGTDHGAAGGATRRRGAVPARALTRRGSRAANGSHRKLCGRSSMPKLKRRDATALGANQPARLLDRRRAGAGQHQISVRLGHHCLPRLPFRRIHSRATSSFSADRSVHPRWRPAMFSILIM
jgi:hypothetical protein